MDSCYFIAAFILFYCTCADGFSEETGGWSVCDRTDTLVTCAVYETRRIRHKHHWSKASRRCLDASVTLNVSEPYIVRLIVVKYVTLSKSCADNDSFHLSVDGKCKEPNHEWLCDSKTQCVQRQSFCNGRVECDDRSDELDCDCKYPCVAPCLSDAPANGSFSRFPPGRVTKVRFASG